MSPATEQRLKGYEGLIGDIDELANLIMDLEDLSVATEEETIATLVEQETKKLATEMYSKIFNKTQSILQRSLTTKEYIKKIINQMLD